jgi:hypothetical protein
MRSPHLRRPERRLAGVALALLGLSAACVHPGNPSVGVKTVAGDVVFGVAPKNPSPVPNTTPLAAPAAPFNQGDLGLPADGANRNLAKPKAPSRTVSAPLCRDATVADVPGELAPDTVKTQRPTAGTYLWKRSGNQKLDAGGGKTFDNPISGYEDRLVQKIAETPAVAGSDSYFEYETVQKDLVGAIKTTHWRVRPNAVNRAVFAPNVGDVNTNVGQPDRGLSMTGVDVRAPNGSTVPAFSPRSPLLFLPLPITVGNKWSSQAVDSRSLATLQVDGGVVGHTNVDACGTLLDGWLVRSTLTFSDGSTTTTSAYNYVVATQYGALIIAEHTEAPKAKPTLVADFNIGQVSPRPLPT